MNTLNASVANVATSTPSPLAARLIPYAFARTGQILAAHLAGAQRVTA